MIVNNVKYLISVSILIYIKSVYQVLITLEHLLYLCFEKNEVKVEPCLIEMLWTS